MGQCYEKLGSHDAITTYQRVVREFGDQKESARAARARLAALQSPTTAQAGPMTRRLWDDVNRVELQRARAVGRRPVCELLG